MVRCYQKKTGRGTFSKEVMQAAVRDVQSGTNIRQAAANFGLNYKTLGRYVKLQEKEGTLESASFGYNTEKKMVFSPALEKLLVEYVLEASAIYYGLTMKELRSLAYEFATKNKLKFPQSWEDNKMAGEDWLTSVRSRHSDILSLRQPEATSLNRMMAFNKTNVGEFFKNLEKVMVKGFTPDRIWNADETGCSTVQTPQRKLAKKGEKRVGSMVSQEKGVTVTLCGTVSATGNSIPPFLVFPRVNVQEHWRQTAPPGSVCEGHPKASGWMTSDNFLSYMQHFVQHVAYGHLQICLCCSF